MPVAAELPIDTSASALDMANAIFGPGVLVQTATFTGAASASGIYSDGDAVAPNVTPADTGVILSTGSAQDITNSSGDVNASSGTTTNHQTAGDADLNAVSGVTTYDAAIIEATFIPTGNVITMQFTFSSEEYLEYVDSGFNDAVGVWVNGTQAQLTAGDGQVSINDFSDVTNENLYLDNPASNEAYNTEMDGLTVTLTLKAVVDPGDINTIKIGIDDGGDGAYDSNLLIAGNSLQTELIANDDQIEVHGTAPEVIDVLGNDTSGSNSALTITQINGVPVTAGYTVTLSTGEMITLNDDGTLSIQGDGDAETNFFSYQVADADGVTDTAFVEMTTVPCFVMGTRIATPQGARRIESLRPGDLVQTRDNGLQPVRWVGTSRRRALGMDAPIWFAADALGRHQPLLLSPNHRILLRSPRAQMHFGESEILIKARDLLNGGSVRRRQRMCFVTYVHLLFDRHEIITGNGLPSESFHPGDETAASFDPETLAELERLFPQLALNEAVSGPAYGPAARRSLKRYEARLLLAG